MKNTKKNTVTFREGILSVTLFAYGSSAVMGINLRIEQDAWIAILAAAVITIPFFLIYSRIIVLFREKNLYEISEILLGKIGGKIVSALLTWYCIHLAALVIRNFSEFIQISSMPETPQIPIAIILMLTSAYLASSNMRSVGKWSVVCIFIIIFLMIFTFAASIKHFKIDDILPIMEYPLKKIVMSSILVVSFPYLETVVFLCIGETLKKDCKPHRVHLYSLSLMVIMFLMVFFRNITLLGRKMMEISYYPSYLTARIIEVGGFATRMEGSISLNFLIGGITKIVVCIMAAANGLKSIFNFANYRTMVLPSALFALALSTILYSNTMEMYNFIKYYAIYAMPFQIVIPIILWIAGEIYTRKKNKAPLN